MMGDRTLTFYEFRACGAPKVFGKKDPIISRRWLAEVGNIFQSSLCHEEAKVRIASCLLKDKDRDWWEEVGHALGGEAIKLMTLEDFMARFLAEFSLVIEVQQLAREF